ncbi:MAG: hypothetical protein ACRD1X_12390 [Vicinamibacteria bacterium]
MGRKKIQVVEDLDGLRALSAVILDDIAYVKTAGGRIYDYDPTETDADDGALAIKPAHKLATQAGRWKRRDLDLSHAMPGTGPLQDPGRRAVNVLRVASNVADEETVTIGADVYEFDRAADGVTAGRIAVTGHANDTPAAATNALITAVNASGTELVAAVDIGDNEVLIVADAVGAVVLACAESLGGANNGWASATMYGGAAAALKALSVQRRVPNAAEVALGNMHFAFSFEPVVVALLVYPTATPGEAKAFDGAVSVVGNVATVVDDGAVNLAETDTVVLIVTE